MPDDVTQAAAPATVGQPASPAVSADVSPVPAVTPQASAQPAAQPAAEPAQAAPVASAPSDDVETLKKRYADSSQEAIRLYRENEELRKKAAQPATPAQPTYTPEQLETWKEQWLVQSAKAASSGDDQKALEAARQIRMIDAELRKQEITGYANRQTASQAYQSLSAEVQPILTQYKDDLIPGTEIYNRAQALYQQAVMAGAAPNEVTATSAALLALAKAGKFQQGVAVKASQDATKHLNQAIKTAAAAGSGAANTNAAATPNIGAMTTEQFQAYRRSLGVGT